MKYILILLTLVPFYSHSKELPSCSVEASREIQSISGLKKGKITVAVKGSPCYKATLSLKIYSGTTIVYDYKHRFKPHVAIHWESLVEKDASDFLKHQLENYNFIKCRELPEIKTNGDLPYYNKLLISEDKYNKLKASNCRAFIHTYKHYEGNRIVIFPLTGEKSIVAR